MNITKAGSRSRNAKNCGSLSAKGAASRPNAARFTSSGFIRRSADANSNVPSSFWMMKLEDAAGKQAARQHARDPLHEAQAGRLWRAEQLGLF